MQYSKDVYGLDKREHSGLRRILLWTMLLLIIFFMLLSAYLFYKTTKLEAEINKLRPKQTTTEKVRVIDQDAPSADELATLGKRYKKNPDSISHLRAYAHGVFAYYLQEPDPELRSLAKELYGDLVAKLALDNRQPLVAEFLALTRINYDQESYLETISWALRVLEAEAENDEALLFLGLAYWKQGDLKGALSAFERYHAVAQDAWSSYVIGILLDMQDKDAAKYLQQAKDSELDSRFSEDAQLRLVLNYLGQKNLVKAQDEASAYIKAHPARAEGYYLLGLVRSAQGRVQEARSLWRKSLNKDQNFSPAIELLRSSE